MAHILWKGDSLRVLDQRRLPLKKTYLRCRDARSVAGAIRSMALRGAPLIGCAAAYGYALAARSLRDSGKSRWPAQLSQAAETLKRARPTAVNLVHAVDRMERKATELLRSPVAADALIRALAAEADSMFQEDIRTNRRMAELGAKLLPPGSKVLTYCNTGALATCGVGTALGVISRAFEQGNVVHVYVCETRPYLQGSRLTLWELMQAGVPCTLITDNMAGHLMAREPVAAVLVGADRVAANADVANKIGTYGLAVLARHHGIPFYVVAPSTTVDLRTPDGAAIPIEERGASEVTAIGGVWIAPRAARARHPAFDVTPHELVTAIVTERGIVQPADETHLRAVISRGETGA